MSEHYYMECKHKDHSKTVTVCEACLIAAYSELDELQQRLQNLERVLHAIVDGHCREHIDHYKHAIIGNELAFRRQAEWKKKADAAYAKTGDRK